MTVLTASQGHKRGRGEQFQVPWGADVLRSHPRWRPAGGDTARFLLISFPATPKLLVHGAGVIPQAFPPCLCLMGCPRCPFRSLLTSSLLSEKWVEVCNTGWENSPPPMLYKKYRPRANP